MSKKTSTSKTAAAMKSNTESSKVSGPPHRSPSVRKHWRYNYPLLESIFLSLLIFLFTGLILNSAVRSIKRHMLITTGVGKEVENFYPNNDYLWRPVQVHSDSRIHIYETFEKKNSTHPIYSYQYQTDIPLEAFLDVLDHPDQSMEWFAWLKDHKYTGVKKEDLQNLDILGNSLNSQMIIRPIIHLHDREFKAKVSADVVTEKWKDGDDLKERTVATFYYENIKPEDQIENKFTKHNHKQCIRGALDMLLQLTTEDEGKTTHVSMELDMDMNPTMSSSFALPKFLMNKMIMRWGVVSLHKLVKQSRDNIGMEDLADVKSSLWRLFPIKR